MSNPVLDGDWSVFFELEAVKQDMAVLCALSYRFAAEFRKDAQDPRAFVMFSYK